MKGSIFKHFESFVVDNWGAQTFEEILAGVTLSHQGPFLGPDNYPDEDLLAIVGATITKLGVPLPDALRAFGKYLFAKLADDAPFALEGMSDLKSFLMTVDGVIHVEVKKLSPQAYLPRIACLDTGASSLQMTYSSERQFCQLFLGLIEGAAERFQTGVEWQETSCTHRGDTQCTFDFQFAQAA